MTCGCDSSGFNPSGGGVTSWDGRTGAVVPLAGDYAASQVTNDSAVVGATVKDALNTLASAPGGVTSWNGRTGAVVPSAGDYAASQVTNDSGVTGATVKDALNALNKFPVDITLLTSFAASPAINQFVKGNGPGVACSWGTLTSSPANPGDNNKLAIALNGDFTYAFLTDVNVASNAAIAVTKLAPSATNGQALITTAGVPTWSTDFVAQSLTTTGNLTLNNAASVFQIGTNTAGATRAATTGAIRLAQALGIVARNSTDTLDIPLIAQGPGSDVTVGSNANVVNVVVAATSQLKLRIVNAVIATITSSGMNLFGTGNTIAFDTAVVSPQINQAGTTTAAGQQLLVAAQSTSFANAQGGLLSLQGGNSNNATPGLLGGVRIGNGPVVMLDLEHLATSRHVLGLVTNTSLTAARMGANTGDFVVYTADAAAIPSADASGGHIYYSDGGKPAFRFNGTNLRFDTTAATATAGGGAALPVTVAGYLTVVINGTTQKIPFYAN